MDRGCGPARGFRDRRDRYPAGMSRRGPATAISVSACSARLARPSRRPTCSATSSPPGCPVPAPSTAPDRRPPSPAAHRRDPARRRRGIGHPRRTDPRPDNLRSGRIGRPAPGRGVAHRHQASPASRPRQPTASHCLPGPDRAGLPRRLRGRHLRHRRRLNPVPGLISAGRPGHRRRACGSRLHLRNLHRRGDDLSLSCLLTISAVALDWPTGSALGLGGYTGARVQVRLPDTLIRRIVGFLVIAIGARYLWSRLS